MNHSSLIWNRPNISKVVIWGYPLYSHTHSFIHYGWFKAFESLGFDTFWFHDDDYPHDFDFSNCLFISEGYADNKIPIVPSSIYFIHICINPQKYLDRNARLIDLRHSVRFLEDYSYSYEMDKSELQLIDSVIYYEENASDLALNQKYRKGISGYEAIYIIWATDLLPNEFNDTSIFLPRTRVVFNVGSVWSANRMELLEFADECRSNGIAFETKGIWREKPTTVQENVSLVQQSFIAPDIRGSGPISADAILERSNHLSTGYIPCRIFKNISYGQLGATNSWAVDDLFEGKVIYNKNVRNLFHAAASERGNFALIREQMEFVRNSHTYVNRVKSLFSIL